MSSFSMHVCDGYLQSLPHIRQVQTQCDYVWGYVTEARRDMQMIRYRIVHPEYKYLGSPHLLSL